MRDYLPEAAARLTDVVGALNQVFARHGYARVVVPTLERIEVVTRGLGGGPASGLFQSVEPGTGEVVAVCPDHTAQVARMWGSSLHGHPTPVRVSYVGPVLRAISHGVGRPREVFQAGVECLGADGALLDAELVTLCAEALAAVGLELATIDLGHAGFVGAVLDAAELGPEDRAAVWTAISRKDAGAVEAVVALAGGPKGASVRRARSALPGLTDLYGGDGLSRARRLARKAGTGDAAIRHLETVLALVDIETAGRVTVDLGEARGLAYYTGLTLHAYAGGASGAVAAGGRYDDLLGRYGPPAPALGFGMDLAWLLEAAPAVPAAPRGVLVVAPKDDDATAVAQAAELRVQGLTPVVIVPHRSRTAALDEARTRGLAEVAFHGKRGWRLVPATP